MNKRIAAGAAFKPNTDDIRDTVLIQNYIWCGCVLYDPKAIHNMKNIFGETIQYSECIDESIRERVRLLS